jgi:class 3 adenylate cyclase
MKFRTKLFYSFISLGVMSSLLALFIIYGESSRLIFDEVRSKILSLASNTAQLIDPEELKNIVDTKGEGKSSLEIKNTLTKIRDLNREGDVYIQNIWILKKYPGSKDYFFIIGLNENEEFFLDYGDAFPANIQVPPDPTTPYVAQNIYSDPWGAQMIGYAPILDDKGEEVGLYGMNVKTTELYRELEKLLFYGVIAFVISILVAVIFAYFLSKIVSSSLGVLCETVKKIGEGEFSSRSALRTQDEFNELSVAINHMAKGLEERERLKLGFSRYVSTYPLEEMLKLDRPIALEGERKKVTILFSDLREFTSIAEHLPPEEVLKLLNEYFSLMIEVIFEHRGTLDKFIGDGLMVEFGAPLDDEQQELHAVSAAIEMQLQLDRLSQKWEKEEKKPLSMGIGIHTGLAVLGSIGSERRMEYTAIGDVVNVASRLEVMTKQLNKPIIISKPVYDKIQADFTFEDLDQVKIPGRVGNIEIYGVDPYNQMSR